MRHRFGSLTDEVPDTGDLREDVLSVLRHNRDTFQEVGPDVVHGLMTEAADLPEDVFRVTPGAIALILERAAARGQARQDRITPRIASLPGDLLRHEMQHPHANPTDGFLAEIVDEIFLPLVATGG